MTADDYKCRECGNYVLYGRDHKTDCKYYISPYFGKVEQS